MARRGSRVFGGGAGAHAAAHAAAALAALALVAQLGCSQNAQKPGKSQRGSGEGATASSPSQAPANPAPANPAPPSAASAGLPAPGPSAAGVSWSVPDRWRAEGPRPMRAATYTIPPAPGDSEGAECGVFFFGSGQGGDAESNIARWVSQFEDSPAPERATRTVDGIAVTLVKIGGDYLAPAGPMMQSQGRKENFRLLGAIVAAPEGSVFFKLTGPANTVAAAEREFDSLIGSVAKD